MAETQLERGKHWQKWGDSCQGPSRFWTILDVFGCVLGSDGSVHCIFKSARTCSTGLQHLLEHSRVVNYLLLIYAMQGVIKSWLINTLINKPGGPICDWLSTQLNYVCYYCIMSASICIGWHFEWMKWIGRPDTALFVKDPCLQRLPLCYSILGKRVKSLRGSEKIGRNFLLFGQFSAYISVIQISPCKVEACRK